MAASDHEAETWFRLVTDYSFNNHADAPVSISELSCLWSGAEKPGEDKVKVYLHGKADNGFRAFYEKVLAWNFDLSSVQPEISVLLGKNQWVKIEKPRKSYEHIIRSELVTVHCLHYLWRNPDASAEALWGHLSKVFRPSPEDLEKHTSLILKAVQREDNLAKSKFITTFLENPSMLKLSVKDVPKQSFIVDNNVDPTEDVEADVDEDEEDIYDNVCAICDNGGYLLCCDGGCYRSFHATAEATEGFECDSLGYSQSQVKAMQHLPFYCKNCEFKQHQCFICKKLGSSDKFSSGSEVFACVSATCGRFYHPHCVAKLLHSKDEAAANELQKNIAEGKYFTCPSHKCYVCNKVENKEVHELQFAVCRCCHRSYHRKCLPKEIYFEDLEDRARTIRAWEGLLPNRILIYCLKHAIVNKLKTPVRNHVKFPDDELRKIPAEERKKKSPPDSQSSRELLKRKFHATNDLPGRNSMKSSDKREAISSAKASGKTKEVNVSSEQTTPRQIDKCIWTIWEQ